jgi:hypothetical protein
MATIKETVRKVMNRPTNEVTPDDPAEHPLVVAALDRLFVAEGGLIEAEGARDRARAGLDAAEAEAADALTAGRRDWATRSEPAKSALENAEQVVRIAKVAVTRAEQNVRDTLDLVGVDTKARIRAEYQAAVRALDRAFSEAVKENARVLEVYERARAVLRVDTDMTVSPVYWPHLRDKVAVWRSQVSAHGVRLDD